MIKYRILYCENCGKIYDFDLNKYGEKCDECGTPLSSAWYSDDGKGVKTISFIEKIDLEENEKEKENENIEK